jgi:hypothetical protein
MKKLGRLVCVLLVLSLLLLAGCGAKDEWEAAEKMAGKLSDKIEDPQLRADTEKLLDAMIADDYDTARDAIYEGVNEADFQQMYASLQPDLAEMEQYTLVASNINKTVKNGISSTNVRYMMTAGEEKFLVDVARIEGYEGLTAFHLNAYQPVTVTGTLGHMQGANAAQWIFLAIGILEIVFTIWMFVDCCRHKIRRKWLWLLLIALGYVILSVIATPEQFRINFNVGAFLSYTSLICYSTGGATCQVVIPVGAIVYLSMRKKLFAGYEAEMQQMPVEENPEEPAALPEIQE